MEITTIKQENQEKQKGGLKGERKILDSTIISIRKSCLVSTSEGGEMLQRKGEKIK